MRLGAIAVLRPRPRRGGSSTDAAVEYLEFVHKKCLTACARNRQVTRQLGSRGVPVRGQSPSTVSVFLGRIQGRGICRFGQRLQEVLPAMPADNEMERKQRSCSRFSMPKRFIGSFNRGRSRRCAILWKATFPLLLDSASPLFLRPNWLIYLESTKVA